MRREQSSVVNVDRDIVTPSGQKKSSSSTTYVTRVTQETPRQKARRVASENSTFFRFVLSGSIGVLFLVMIMLVGTVEYYEVNSEQLNWINNDGTFNENSYNLQVTLTNDTPLNDLNGLTLNEVFNSNKFVNGDFTDGTNGWNVNTFDGVSLNIINDSLQITSTSPGRVWLYQNGLSFNSGDTYYLRFDINITQGTLSLWNYVGGGSIATNRDFMWSSITNYNGIYSKKSNASLNNDGFFIGNTATQSINVIYLDNFILLNLNDLGIINLTQQQLDNYFDIWQENKEKRSIETYYGLGDVIVSNYVGFGENVINPATRIFDYLRQGIKFGRDSRDIPFDETQPEAVLNQNLLDFFRRLFGGGE